MCAGSAQPCAWNCGEGLSPPASPGREVGEIRREGQALTSPLRAVSLAPCGIYTHYLLNPHQSPKGLRLSYLLFVEEEAGSDCCSNLSKVTQQGREEILIQNPALPPSGAQALSSFWPS